MNNVSPLQNNILQEIKNDKNHEEIFATPDLVTEWKKNYLREGHTVHSTTTYYNYLKRFVGYGIKINQKNVDKFRENNMSGACAGALKNFFKFLVNKKGFSKEILFIHFDKSKSIRKFPRHLTHFEVEKIIEAMPSLMEKNMTLVIYELGLRISEALKLKWEDFNWLEWIQDKSQFGTVNLKNTKGGKFRSIPVPPYLMLKLYNDHKLKSNTGVPIGGLIFDFGIRYYQDGNESIQEKQYNYLVIYAEDRYRKLLYKVSHQVLGRKINPHQLRHSKAMDLINNGVPIETIKAFLGHSKISTTEIYAQASAEKIKRDLQIYYEQKKNS